MKRVSSFLITFILILSLVSPFTVKADSFSVSEFYTRSSVSGMFSDNYIGSLDTVDRQALANWIFSVTNTDLTSEVIDYVNDYPYLSSIGSGSSLLFTYNPFTRVIYAFQFSGVDSSYLIYDNRYDLGVFTNALITGSNPQLDHYSSIMLNSQNTPTWTDGIYSVTSYDDYRYVALVGYPIAFYGVNAVLGLPEYAANNELNLGTIQANFAPFISDYENGIGNYTNYIDGLQVWNGEEMVDPVPDLSTEESNLNHLYFKSCDIGFCEPYGATNFSTFGGAYFYIKYQVDDWILEHINEYDIYFSATGYVGSRQYNGSKRVSLDQDGCITIPFSDIFTTDGGVVSNGFVSAVSSKVVDQRFYKTYLYSIAGEKLQNFIDKQNSVSGSFTSAWNDLVHTVKETYFFVYNGGNGFSEVIQDVVQSQITSLSTVYKNYKINTLVYLVDSNDNKSGNVGRIFDLYQGSDTSTDNQGLENENPYVDENDDYLPDIPDNNQVIETSTNGSGINVYNMTPSQIKLVIDNGFEKFIAWYNSDPSTSDVSSGFWNSFGVFRNNPAADLYNEYFGFLPTTFKNIILGCATIGIVGGVFCAIRRKLT